MVRPVPTQVLHFTHVRNLPGIVAHGLLADLTVQRRGVLQVEVGDPAIKGPRRRQQVDRGPGGVVAEYVPFYFAPRSPMLFCIDRGNVPSYQGGCEPLIYLVTSMERLVTAGLAVVVTDRNARLATSTFRLATDNLDDHVDWPLMQAAVWRNTPALPDRKERRMAECLVHGSMPWSAVAEVATKTADVQRRVGGILATVGSGVPITVRPGWYF